MYFLLHQVQNLFQEEHLKEQPRWPRWPRRPGGPMGPDAGSFGGTFAPGLFDNLPDNLLDDLKDEAPMGQWDPKVEDLVQCLNLLQVKDQARWTRNASAR